MDAADLAAVLVAVVCLAAIAVLVVAVFSLVRTLRTLRETVDVLREQAVPLVADLRRAVDHATSGLDRVDDLLDTAEDISTTMDAASRLTYRAFSPPLIGVASVAAGFGRFVRRLGAAPRSAAALTRWSRPRRSRSGPIGDGMVPPDAQAPRLAAQRLAHRYRLVGLATTPGPPWRGAVHARAPASRGGRPGHGDAPKRPADRRRVLRGDPGRSGRGGPYPQRPGPRVRRPSQAPAPPVHALTRSCSAPCLPLSRPGCVTCPASRRAIPRLGRS